MFDKNVRSFLDTDNQKRLDNQIKEFELHKAHNTRYNAAERHNTQTELTEHEQALTPKRLKKFEK